MTKTPFAGFADQIGQFCSADPELILSNLQEKESASPQQIDAWRHSLHAFQDMLKRLQTSANPPSQSAVHHSDINQNNINQNNINQKSVGQFNDKQYSADQFAVDKWGIVFEYYLPMEIGRRPDIVIITQSHVFVIEVKDSATITPAHLSQIKAYARDLENYHAGCANKQLHGILLPLKASPSNALPLSDIPLTAQTGIDKEKDGIRIMDLGALEGYLRQFASEPFSAKELEDWLHAAYEPLPTLIDAAKKVFRDEPLPHIKRANSAGIPETLRKMDEIVQEAKTNGGYHLILVGGVPGSGKTLVGLQFVHEHADQEALSVFLSGNGPLVRVLQDYLGSEGRTFVRDVNAFIEDQYIMQRDPSKWHIIVFDEAQRAWDADKVADYINKKRGRHQEIASRITHLHKSEAEIFAELVSTFPKWGILIALIGDGQEIHIGEEAGIEQWKEAIEYCNNLQNIQNTTQTVWNIHCPPRLASHFQAFKERCHSIPELDLTLTIRSHASQQLHSFVNALLTGDIAKAAALSVELKKSGYFLYITDQLEHAKDLLRSIYDGVGNAGYQQPTKANEQRAIEEGVPKTYGMMASTWAKSLIDYGIDVRGDKDPRAICNRFFGANDVPRYYNLRKGVNTKWYCTTFNKLATEFDCQGLELDGVLLAWGTDYKWSRTQNRWIPYTARQRTKDPAKIRLNSYRVLLTRARDGIVIFCPGEDLRDTFTVLCQAGFEKIALDTTSEQMDTKSVGVSP